MWDEITGTDFTQIINSSYAEIVHWRRNLFKVPSGKPGKAFVKELARLFASYGEESALEAIALKAAFTLPVLMLQKPNPRSKTKEHSVHLQRRLDLWKKGDLNSLLLEGRTIQQQLRRSQKGTTGNYDKSRRFATLIKEGKLKAAIRLLHDNKVGSPLTPNDEVIESLLSKHPPRQPPSTEAIIESSGSIDPVHPILFEQIDGKLILDSALKSDGAAGPSGVDAAGWKRLCSSFGQCSVDLCNAIAIVTKRICTSYVDPHGISALVACRLIALDKCPGVRPIAIGETVRRIIGRAILSIIKASIMEAAGPKQLCAGQEAGCEAAIHAMRDIFENKNSDAVLLVDASNAFNSLNRENALRNIQKLCPSLATVLINTYREDVPLYINDKTIFSQEGTTQGDPLAMAMYAIAMIPLINKLQDPNVKQIWFADDATASAHLHSLRNWWDALLKYGPAFGYFPNAEKSWIVVKDGNLEEAKEVFQNTAINITTEGRRHLGSALGSTSFVENFVQMKIESWVGEIQSLAEIAATQPHAAYAAYTHYTMNKWNFLMRTIPGITDLLQPLEDAITTKLLPALTGRSAISSLERELISLPARLGGLGIPNPTQQADIQYQNSRKITAPMAALIIQQHQEVSEQPDSYQANTKYEIYKQKKQRERGKLDDLMNKLSPHMKKATQMACEKGASIWLTALPLDEHGFFLHKGDFRDALALRYGWQPTRLPKNCVCGQPFTVDHSLICSCGGFPTIRHNEVRDITADLLSEVCYNVGIEPTLQSLSGETLRHATANREDGACLDVVADNFWGRKQRAFFDIRVFYPLAPSYRRTPLESCYRAKENEKKRSYDERIREVEGGTFSPLVFSTSGGVGPSAAVMYKRLASLIAEKRDQSYSTTIKWIRCRITFALIRSAILCLRGHQSRQRCPRRSEATDMILASAESHI